MESSTESTRLARMKQMAPRRHERRGAADRIRPHETHGRYPNAPASTRPRREEAGKSAVTRSGGRSRSRKTGGRSLGAVAVRRGLAVVAAVAVGGLAVAIP